MCYFEKKKKPLRTLFLCFPALSNTSSHNSRDLIRRIFSEEANSVRFSFQWRRSRNRRSASNLIFEIENRGVREVISLKTRLSELRAEVEVLTTQPVFRPSVFTVL